eukprot:364414-Chlamydomonas_euryale.AAC.3
MVFPSSPLVKSLSLLASMARTAPLCAPSAYSVDPAAASITWTEPSPQPTRARPPVGTDEQRCSSSWACAHHRPTPHNFAPHHLSWAPCLVATLPHSNPTSAAPRPPHTLAILHLLLCNINSHATLPHHGPGPPPRTCHGHGVREVGQLECGHERKRLAWVEHARGAVGAAGDDVTAARWAA